MGGKSRSSILLADVLLLALGRLLLLGLLMALRCRVLVGLGLGLLPLLAFGPFLASLGLGAGHAGRNKAISPPESWKMGWKNMLMRASTKRAGKRDSRPAFLDFGAARLGQLNSSWPKPLRQALPSRATPRSQTPWAESRG